MGYLVQTHNDRLAQCGCADDVAHGIGRSLKDLAYKRVLDKFLSCCRQRIACAHFGQLHFVDNSCTEQLTDSRRYCLVVCVVVREAVKAADVIGDARENIVGDNLAEFHRVLWLALFLLLFSVETCERGCIVGQLLIRDKHHTRMFHAVYLFGSETVHLSELAQVVDIRLVCSLLGCNVARHGAVVARKHYTVLAHDDRRLQGAAVVTVGNVPHYPLCVRVALVVAVVHALTVLVNGETLGRLKGVVHIVTC